MEKFSESLTDSRTYYKVKRTEIIWCKHGKRQVYH